MKAAAVTIVGLGPRGLSLLERLATLLRQRPATPALRIDIVEPGMCGQGAHLVEQPDHLLVNTVASQLGLFARDSVAAGAEGLSLTNWARWSGYRRCGTRFLRAGANTGEAISDHDHLPRQLLGAYLCWCFERIAASLPAHVELLHHAQRVDRLTALADGTFRVGLDNGREHGADFVFLATGHGMRLADAADQAFHALVAAQARNNPRLAYFPSAYPIRKLDAIPASATVAIQGMGLTAYDVISALTIGRGGHFGGAGPDDAYHASGSEPKLLLCSRNCLPFGARAVNQKGITGRHQARFFTVDAVHALRSRAQVSRNSPQLDFLHEVMPLIVSEMAYAYRSARSGHAIEADTFAPSAQELAALSALLKPLQGQSFACFRDFESFYRAQMVADLEQARQGNLTSAVKAAADVLRDTRDALRAAVEFNGLTPASHQYFIEDFVGTANRIAFGPPARRNAELLALMDAGILEVAGGPGCSIRHYQDKARFCITNTFGGAAVEWLADALVVARLDTFSPRTDASVLTGQLVGTGLARPHMNDDYHPGGFDINQKLQVIAQDGRAHANLWALGFPVEGAHFYTHALPRPLMASRFTQDAELCISQLLRALQHLPPR